MTKQARPHRDAPLVMELEHPPLLVLDKPERLPVGSFDASLIPAALRRFEIESEVVESISGPIITRVLVRPHTIGKISALGRMEAEIAFVLQVQSVHITTENELGLVSFEIPNRERTTIKLSSLMVDHRDRRGLEFPAGLAVDGTPIWFDLADAPHLLVAGTTGSGKSTFIHQLLTSYLLRLHPRQMRLVLIDLKRGVEFSAYEILPHLFTDNAYSPEAAMSALIHCEEEMERRYSMFKEAGARNIEEYEDLELPIPRILVVVDELAYLVTDHPEIEGKIITLSQLGRAAGIHLVLATQHPSRDVVSGRIKANFAARVGFTTGSKVDSTVILDHPGAERLLGRGDSIFRIPGYDEQRIATALVASNEVGATVNWWLTEWSGSFPRPLA